MTIEFDRRALIAGFGSFALGATLIPGAARAASAGEILAATDRLRNPQQSFRSQITITEYIGGRKNDEMAITVYSKPRPSDGQFRSIVHIDAPRKDAGKLMLRDGKDLYFYDPDAANTIRISPQQRLLGQASNGDVMTTNFSRDYRADLAGTETVEDARKAQRNCYKLKLKASNKAAVYGSIDYWVDAKSMHPVKGRFHSSSGRLMKIAFYDEYRQTMGALRPTKASIIDGLDTSKVTVMRFAKFTAVDLPDAWFQKSYLPRFRKS
ncbi:MAG: outer membrane lipoprotein-sorting protein [Tropicimonas sp.]|uniref:outer membrane lipoprotein-sorting protein n=1 Tax=Tropicimonas sp. TaxID=2067044 RepID=UPI003A86A026